VSLECGGLKPESGPPRPPLSPALGGANAEHASRHEREQPGGAVSPVGASYLGGVGQAYSEMHSL